MSNVSRRTALKAASALAVPFIWRSFGHAAPSETLLHVSVGAGGMAGADISSLIGSKRLKLVAVADVDDTRAEAAKAKYTGIETFRDWREMYDKVKFDSANISTPDHMHAAPTMRAIKSGKHVYTQKPLTQTIYEARQLTLAAEEAKIVSQMGIQIHSAAEHKMVVALIQSGAIGLVQEVHSVSGKDWGDNSPKPDRKDPIPKTLDWDLWLGVAQDRPYIAGGYYHPGNWRKRLDFGTGTFGDMGCHILDPVFGSLGVGNPSSIISRGEAPNATNWGLNGEVEFTFPGTKFTAKTVTITWYNGQRRPPASITDKIAPHKLGSQGSIYIGTKGVMFSPYIGMPILLPVEEFKGYKMPEVKAANHYHEWVDAARGVGAASAPFSYSGPLTEMVLLGCLATRFPNKTIEWDTKKLEVTNIPEANQYVKKAYRKGWEEKGI